MAAANDSDSGALGLAAVRAIAAAAMARVAADGRADAELAAELRAIEAERAMTPSGRVAFESLLATLGVASNRAIGLPADDTPYWLRAGHPLEGYRTAERLPDAVDILVIGAGLTGASAAFHLAPSVQATGLRVAVIDRADPATEASGRNGGHFETIPENSVGLYEGLAHERFRFLRRCYPSIAAEVLHAEAERQASVVLRFALRNRTRMREIIQAHGIDCDFAPRGWLFIAHTEREEQAICDEVVLAAQHGERIELWSRAKIRAEFGFESDFLGRFVGGDGSYHPFKYTCGLLQRALTAGVELYTRVAVLGIQSTDRDHHEVDTAEGTIAARRVVVATNAFTREVLPELASITPRQSQVMVTEHALDRAKGRIVTTERGPGHAAVPAYFNQPRGGRRGGRAPLLMGGGHDRPMENPASRRRSRAVHSQLLTTRDALYPELRGQPPSAEWIGPMGFTPDQLPAVGLLRPGVIVAAGFNGYGGSYTTAAGEAAATIALTDDVPEWVPEDVFSPTRLIESEPLFLRAQDSLWRTAASLCAQLRAVTIELAETIAVDSPAASATSRAASGGAGRRSISTDQLDIAELASLASFADFLPAEIEDTLQYMRAFNVSADEVLCTEGEPGGSAMVVVRGTIAVTIRVRGRDQPLSMLEAGAMFGQLSLVQREPRSATCATTTDALLLEIDDDACNRLLAQRSGTALKFLGALTYDVIAALRAADRRLVRLRRADAEGLKEELLRAANVDVRTHLEPYNRASSYP